ncbi:MAG: hypothetical protein P3A28_08960 [Gemmatimonadota bacterium]|nr:hypothetical protein [Gemmatimonadota bacterium]
MLARSAFAAGLLIAAPASAQPPLPEWKFGDPRVEIGRDGAIEFFRIGGAALLPNGQIAIGDGGNSRIVIVDAGGKQVRTFGRKGAGPGAFETLASLYAFGDTVIAIGGPGSRIIAWRAEGTPLYTVQPTGPRETMATVRGPMSARRFIITYAPNRLDAPDGIITDTANIGLFDATTRTLTELGRRAWGVSYVYRQALTKTEGGRTFTLEGTTVYRTPFLGETLVASVDGRIVYMPRGGNTVEIGLGTDQPSTRIALPISRPPFDRTGVTLHRDSLIALSKRSGPDPDTESRLNAVFGSGFPIPRELSTIESLRVMGPNVWLRAFPVRADSMASWFVLNPAAGRVIARLLIHKNWQLLGGDEHTALVLRRDSDGVEYVAVMPVVR